MGTSIQFSTIIKYILKIVCFDMLLNTKCKCMITILQVNMELPQEKEIGNDV